MSDLRKQELHCHDCNKYVQFEVDMSLNGNHVLNCPNCDHEHCRVVKDGVITSERWDSRNGDAGMVYAVSTATTSYSGTSTWDTYSTGTAGGGTDTAADNSSFLYESWTNVGAG